MSEEHQASTKDPDTDKRAQIAGSQKLIITVHGIRTFGEWQIRLEELIDQSDTIHKIHVHPVNYGYFSVFAFLLPFARYLAAWRIRKQILRKIQARHWDSIDVVAHSFGTYLVAHSIRWLQKNHPQIRIRTVILAGSVLPPKFSWDRLLLDGDRPCVGRVVNDCGTKDKILILSQLLVPFSSMAGRVGFQGVMGPNFRNRYFDFGHSGYFVSRDEPNDFMKIWWLPLLLNEQSIVPHDERDTTLLSGPKTFLINHAEIFKQGVFVATLYYLIFLPIQDLHQTAEMYRVETSKQKLLRDAETHVARDYRLLAALELERRGFWAEAEPLLRNELAHTPKVYAVLDLEPGEQLASLDANANYVTTVGSESGKIRIRDVKTGHTVNSQETERPPKAVAVRPDGAIIAASFEGNFIWIKSNGGSELEHHFSSKSAIQEVAFSDNSTYLAAQSGTEVKILNLSSGESYFLPHPDYVAALDFSPGGKYIVTFTHNDELIYIHELGSDHSTKIITRNNPLDWKSTLALRFIKVSHDGKYVAGVGKELLHIWDVETGDKIFEVRHGINVAESHLKELLSFDKLAKSFVVADADGKVTRWIFPAPISGSAMHHMTVQGKLLRITQALDGRFLFVGQRGSRIVFWEETDWIGESEALRCSSGGKFTATHHNDDQIRVWGAKGYPLIANAEVDLLQDFAVSETHQALTVLDQIGTVTISPLTSSNSMQKIKIGDHRNLKLYKSALSPNGEFAAFALGDRKIWLWDVYSSSILGSVDARIGQSLTHNHYISISELSLSCDGKAVRVQGQECDDDRNDCDDVDRSWQLGTEQWTSSLGWDDKCGAKKIGGLCDIESFEKMLPAGLVNQSRQRITRNFTLPEWQEYFDDESYHQIDSDLPTRY